MGVFLCGKPGWVVIYGVGSHPGPISSETQDPGSRPSRKRVPYLFLLLRRRVLSHLKFRVVLVTCDPEPVGPTPSLIPLLVTPSPKDGRQWWFLPVPVGSRLLGVLFTTEVYSSRTIQDSVPLSGDRLRHSTPVKIGKCLLFCPGLSP